MKDSKEWKGEMLVLSLLILIGTILRTYKLGFNSLWLDEAATFSLSVVPLDKIWSNMTTGEFNPPLFFVIEHFMLMLSNNEVTLRFMPAVFGILTIPVMYLVGKEFLDKYVGLIAAGVFTFSPFLILYSQEARAYSLMLLLCAGMLLFYLKAIKKNTLVDWLPFAVLAIVAIWTHFYSIVFIALLAGFAAYRFRDNLKPLFLAMAIWFAFCMPIFYVLIDLIRMRTETAPTFGIQGLSVVLAIFYEMSGYTVIVAVIMLVLMVMGLLWAFANAYEQYSLLVWLILLTVAISVVLSYAIPMLPRYLIFLTIPFYLGIGLAYKPIINIVGRDYKSAYAVFWIILFFGMMGIPFYTTYYQNYSKEDWRGVASELRTLTNPGDVVIAVPNYVILPLEYYYDASADGTSLGAFSTLEELDAARNETQNATYYVITQDIKAVDPNMRAGTWLMQNSFIVTEFSGVTITRSLPHV